jgi:hypothetical protein
MGGDGGTAAELGAYWGDGWTAHSLEVLDRFWMLKRYRMNHKEHVAVRMPTNISINSAKSAGTR